MDREPSPVDLRDYVEFALDRPVGRRVYTSDVLALDVVSLEPGQVLSPRAFETADAVYTVLAGIAWVVTDAGEVTLQALQAILVPAGIVHGLRNNSPDPLIIQVVTSPPDEAPEAVSGPVGEATRFERERPERRLLERLRRGLGSG